MPRLTNQLFTDNFNADSIKKLFKILEMSQDINADNNLFSCFSSIDFVQNFIKMGF